MKKIIFMLSLFGAILFAAPNTPYVYRVHSIVDVNGQYYWFDDYLNGEYRIENIREAVPLVGTTTIPVWNYYSEYIALMPVQYNETAYIHNQVLVGQSTIYIDVYFPATTPSGSAVFIWERNQYERANNLNDRLIKGYAVSPYEVAHADYTDGSKLVRYLVPDISSYHKRITIATCPNNQSQTQAVCTYTAMDIMGSTDYPE